MDYARHYDRLIERARGRDSPAGYTETHHVVPRCMGGTDDADNLVELTPEEHYVAHQLLVKIHPGVRGLVSALFLMTGENDNNPGRSNKIYGWLKRKWAETEMSPESRAKISAALKGKKTGPMPEETKAKLSDALTGRSLSPEHCKKISESQIGRTYSPETLAKMSEVRLGVKRGPYKKSGNPTKARGVPKSPEHRAALSEAKRGKKRPPRSEEWRRKQGEAIRRALANRREITVEETDRIIEQVKTRPVRDVARDFGLSSHQVKSVVRQQTRRATAPTQEQ